MIHVTSLIFVQTPEVLSARHDQRKKAKLIDAEKLPLAGSYPENALLANAGGLTSVLLKISKTGGVTSCVVTETSGRKDLDKATCTIFAKAHFDPARSETGETIESDEREVAAWSVDRRFKESYGVVLDVTSIPSGYKQPAKLEIVYNADGHLSSCEITGSSGNVSADNAACEYLKTSTIKPVLSGSNAPAAAVRHVTAAFSVPKN